MKFLYIIILCFQTTASFASKHKITKEYCQQQYLYPQAPSPYDYRFVEFLETYNDLKEQRFFKEEDRIFKTFLLKSPNKKEVTFSDVILTILKNNPGYSKYRIIDSYFSFQFFKHVNKRLDSDLGDFKTEKSIINQYILSEVIPYKKKGGSVKKTKKSSKDLDPLPKISQGDSVNTYGKDNNAFFTTSSRTVKFEIKDHNPRILQAVETKENAEVIELKELNTSLNEEDEFIRQEILNLIFEMYPSIESFVEETELSSSYVREVLKGARQITPKFKEFLEELGILF